MTNNEVYDVLKEWHEKYVPSLRFCQFMYDFFNWHKEFFNNDVYYLENKLFLYRLNYYLSCILKVKERDNYPYAQLER